MQYNLILGSGSPRRKELLSAIWQGRIDIITSDIEETYSADLAIEKIPSYLAEKKGADILSKISLDDRILLTADTIVICENKVLGKPIDIANAKAMLEFLSNKMHRVITGVAIYSSTKKIVLEVETKVYFGKLATSDIDYYITNYNPLDKAGAYGIQDYIGMMGIEKIEGCYYNVMGLPTYQVGVALRSMLY